MSKECLAREARFNKFVENCADKIYSNKPHDNRFIKCLFIRICAGQQNLKKLYFKGYERKLLYAARLGPTLFFSEVIALTLKLPRIMGFIILKLHFTFILIKSLIHGCGKKSAKIIEKTNNKALLVSNLRRFTLRFIEIINKYEYTFEVSLNGKVQVLDRTLQNTLFFFLPRLNIRQNLLILLSPTWQTSYLIRALRLKNLIEKFDFKQIYIMDGDAPSHVSAAYAASLSSIPSIGIQWGGMPMGVKPGYKLFPFDSFLCNGQFYVDLLKPLSKNTKFSVCSPKNKIIYLENTTKVQSRNRSFLFLLDSGTVISKQESDGLINICLNTKRRYPALNVTARPHPRMNLDPDVISNMRSIGIIVGNSQSPVSALIANKIVIGHVSSMMVECLEYDCLPVFYDIGLDEIYPDLFKLSIAKKIKNEKEWFTLLDNILSNRCKYVTPSHLKIALFGHD